MLTLLKNFIYWIGFLQAWFYIIRPLVYSQSLQFAIIFTLNIEVLTKLCRIMILSLFRGNDFYISLRLGLK